MNTPVQLFLAFSRIARARSEIRVYTELLKGARPALLEGTISFLSLSKFLIFIYVLLEFEEIAKQSVAEVNSMGVWPVTPISV